jgi:hypothetical protein
MYTKHVPLAFCGEKSAPVTLYWISNNADEVF